MSDEATDDAIDETTDAALEVLWQRALAAWEDDKIHVAVLEYALRAQALPEVAGRYRSLVSDPERGARAQKRLDALVAAATATLFATKTPKPEKVPLPITLSAFGVCAVLLGWLAWALWGPR
ncbi:MAG TPA: hypothetical protein VII82_00100 [Polyangiaceae bacterium]|jgi:hypothetical protein